MKDVAEGGYDGLYLVARGTFQNKEFYNKQVTSNIGLTYTIILSSFICFIYLTYMGRTASCEPIRINFGNHISS